MYISNSKGVIRLDTTTSRITSINTIQEAQDYQAQSIVAISNNEVFYSFRARNSSIHHLVKANFSQADDSSFLMDEKYHTTIAGNSTYGSVSRLSQDNATIWHAVNLDTYVIYFQLNLSDFSLIGSGHNLTHSINNSGIGMEVSQEVV